LETRNLLSTYVVDHLADDMVGDGLNGSLRYCITNATNGDDIQFGVTGTINLTGALPNLTHSISIEGPGPDQLTVRRDTGGNYDIFAIGLAASVSISGLTISNGLVASAGGGIDNAGTLIVANSILSGNHSGYYGEGGGGIFNNGVLTVTNSTFSENGTASDGESQFGGGGILNFWYGTLKVNNSTFSANFGLDGGGICNVSYYTSNAVSQCIFSGNSAYIGGGGIYSDGMLSIIDSTIAGNLAYNGGGIATGYGHPLTISNSTISGNAATGAYGRGGGIANSYELLTISNSTISGNAATGAYGSGGGIATDYGGSLAISNSTIAGNSSIGQGGGVFNYPGYIFNARNTIIGENMAPTGPDIFGSLTASGYNLIGNTEGGSGFDPTDLLNVDALLGPLQDNGGPTQTMALLDGSPAIDAGDNTDAPDWDQRGPGYPRITPDDPVIDIGAFEVQQDGGNGPGRSVPLHAKSLHLDLAALLPLEFSPSGAALSSLTPGSAQPQGTWAGPQLAVVDRLFASLNKGDAGVALAEIKLVVPDLLGARDQTTTFLSVDDTEIIHPEPGRFFEMPIQGPLPEDLNCIP
jgi:hypothetical protein